MGKTKILIAPNIRTKIESSSELKEKEKKTFLRFIAYLTPEETQDLMLII